MKFVGATVKLKGKFLNYVDLVYVTKDGTAKVYETVQRKIERNGYKIGHHDTQSVTMLVFNEDKTKVLLNKEFRLSVNREVYNLPSGLIDYGETTEEAVERELKEETGLDVVEILKILNPSFVSIGESNTTGAMVYLVAKGVPQSEDNPNEEIEPIWVDKQQARDILKTDAITARTQVILDMWANGLPI